MNAFVALAKTGSYTETAKQLCVTHSAISHSMRALEEQMGCRLFYKLGKKITPTEAGEALLHHATRALEEMRRARATLGELKKWGSRRLRLAVDAAFFSDLLRTAFARFHEKMPNTSIQAEFCKAGESVNLLETNQVDLVLSEKLTIHDRFEFIPLLAGSSYFVIRSGHPLDGMSNVPPDQVAQYPCILLRDSGHTRKQLEHSLSRRGTRLNFVGEIENIDMVKHMVKRTTAMSFLPRWSVLPELERKTLSILPLTYRPPSRIWGVAHLSGHPLNHTETTFVKLCVDELKKARRGYELF